MIRCPKCEYDNPPETRFCGSCGTRLAPSTPSASGATQGQTQTLQTAFQELPVGSLFAGRYLILESLGRGGMGRVYRALDKKLDVEVALKLLRPEVAADPGIIERFKNELKLARMISHPHVCRMYDLSEDQGMHFITMEYVPGEDLKTTVRRVGPLGLGKALSIAKQVCEGLAAAHRLDIVHRDLKPQNIMLDRSGQVRIMDFGISRSLRAKGMTADGTMIGTPEYISPEQAEGKKIDARTDLYAFGVILFEMVTGKVPFDGDTTLSIILKHKLEPAPDPKRINPGLPRELSQVILKCLEKDRERRYASADAVYADLVRVEAQIEGKAPAKPARPAGPRWRRIPLPALIAGGAAVLIAGFLIIRPFGSKGPAPPPVASPGQTSAAGLEAKATPETKPAAPRPPGPNESLLEITTVPDGAGVFLNGKLLGSSPLKQNLASGNYEIKVRKSPDYRDIVDRLTLQPGESRSRHYLLSPLYSLEVRTDPPGADLRIDGILRGKTPLTVEVSKSSIQFGLRLGDDWAPLSESLKLKPGLTVIERTLQRAARPSAGPAPTASGQPAGAASPTPPAASGSAPSPPPARPGRVRVNILPYADVFVDDKSIGEVPPIRTIELAEGKHALRFESAGLKKSLALNLPVKADDRLEVRVNMVTEDIKVLPWKEGPAP